jgi:serine/threonine protein kinase
MNVIYSILGPYSNNYKILAKLDETNLSTIYKAFNITSNREVCLKVIDKEELKKGDYDFLLEQANKEGEITKLCNSEYTINFYGKLENQRYIIYELEYIEFSLRRLIDKEKTEKSGYMINNFKTIVLGISRGLKIINERGIMHRDIKPDNIFIKIINGNYYNPLIKIGDFGCSTYIKTNNSEPIGSILYTAPEIIKNVKYDEKCDLWSLGITLFETYFTYLPYGYDVTVNKIMNIIYDEKNFKFPKTNIPNLDIFFRRLLCINPRERMDYRELFNYVSSPDFMNKNIICVNGNNNYMKIHQIISMQKDVKLKNKPENDSQKHNMNKIISLVEAGHLPDIMSFPNGRLKGKPIYNNILYYDDNLNFLSSINKDSDLFEHYTPGAFILCTNDKSLGLIKDEIIRQMKRDKKTYFNIITSGRSCEKIIKYLDRNRDFLCCINKICVYCLDLNAWSPLKNRYKIIYGVFNTTRDIITFIYKFANEDIKPFPITKLLTYNDYCNKYKYRHFKVSLFYGDLTPSTYKQNIIRIKQLIKKEGKEQELFQENEEKVFEGFLKFDIKKDLDNLDKLIIKEYTKNTFYGDLNKWLMNSKMNNYTPVAYFTARLMYSLNQYAKNNQLYCIENKKELHRGVKMSYSSLLPYERAKGKIILLSAFTSTSESDLLAKRWAGRDDTVSLYKTNLKFSVVFNIKNNFKKKWISNGINVQQLSEFQDEKEILYQPFSFYYVRDVHIDIVNYMADIFLETIGKEEILEEQIKMGKNIIFNEKEKIMQAIK